MTQRAIGLAFAIGMTGVALSAAGCVQPNKVRNERHGLANTGAGSLMETRKALEGSWTLVSLEAIDEQGARRPVKASGQLAYDAYSNMTIRAVVEDPALTTPLVLDYQGRIFIDPVKKEFYPADLRSDKPVELSQTPAIAPDKVRRYELTPDAFVVTYLDASAKPTFVARWRRP